MPEFSTTGDVCSLSDSQFVAGATPMMNLGLCFFKGSPAEQRYTFMIPVPAYELLNSPGLGAQVSVILATATPASA